MLPLRFPTFGRHCGGGVFDRCHQEGQRGAVREPLVSRQHACEGDEHQQPEESAFVRSGNDPRRAGADAELQALERESGGGTGGVSMWTSEVPRVFVLEAAALHDEVAGNISDVSYVVPIFNMPFFSQTAKQACTNDCISL